MQLADCYRVYTHVWVPRKIAPASNIVFMSNTKGKGAYHALGNRGKPLLASQLANVNLLPIGFDTSNFCFE
jgi:hypothetical protein